MFTEKNPPYGLTPRYPAEKLHFINNTLNAIILIITQNIFPSLECCVSCHRTLIKKSSLPSMSYYLFLFSAFPPPPLLYACTLPTTGTLQIGPGAWNNWGRGMCRFQNGVCINSSTHQRGASSRSPSEHSDMLIKDLAITFCQSPECCAVLLGAVLIKLPNL